MPSAPGCTPAGVLLVSQMKNTLESYSINSFAFAQFKFFHVSGLQGIFPASIRPTVPHTYEAIEYYDSFWGKSLHVWKGTVN